MNPKERRRKKRKRKKHQKVKNRQLRTKVESQLEMQLLMVTQLRMLLLPALKEKKAILDLICLKALKLTQPTKRR